MLTLHRLAVHQPTQAARIFSDSIPSVTYEGDNSVLLQQTARFVIMKDKEQQMEKPNTIVDCADLVGVEKMLEYIVAAETKVVKALLESESVGNIGFNTVWNERVQRPIIEFSKLWGYKMLVRSLRESLPRVQREYPIFRKIAQKFCSFIVRQVSVHAFYGFTVQGSAPAFSEPELNQVLSFERPIPREIEQVQLPGRGGAWLTARL